VTDSKTADDNADWLTSWLETQRVWVQRWSEASDGQRIDAIREGMEAFRKQVLTPAPETVGVMQKFQEWLQASFLAGGDSLHGAEQTPLQAAWQQWLNAFPLGHAREQQAAWQEVMRAAAEYQALSQQLADTFVAVMKAALESVPQQVEARAAGGKRLESYRELYDLWIEESERHFAKLAREDRFVDLQTRLNTAQLQLRRRQQRVIEYSLKQFDLPTRAELNSLHQRVRELSARLEALERGQDAPPANAAPAAAPKKQKSSG
jgi:class III poly(R)-hydroxyalkanoic acid synthase PhaE subunit